MLRNHLTHLYYMYFEQLHYYRIYNMYSENSYAPESDYMNYET